MLCGCKGSALEFQRVPSNLPHEEPQAAADLTEVRALNATTRCSAYLSFSPGSWHVSADADRPGRFSLSFALSYRFFLKEPVSAGALGPDPGRDLVPPAPRIPVSQVLREYSGERWLVLCW